MYHAILYSTGCPLCKMLKARLDAAGITYELNSDVEYMKAKGFTSVPMLEVDNVVMNASEAMKWVQEVVK